MCQDQISQILPRDTFAISFLLNPTSDPRLANPRNAHQFLHECLTTKNPSISLSDLNFGTPEQSSVFLHGRYQIHFPKSETLVRKIPKLHQGSEQILIHSNA
ncbi:hypothetical protein V6Z11_A01G028400 [Gossypium hirsutum]